jgi:hypothetical protein
VKAPALGVDDVVVRLGLGIEQHLALGQRERAQEALFHEQVERLYTVARERMGNEARTLSQT